MTVDRTELIKQAYAYGCSVALSEVGYDRKTAEETAVKFAAEAPVHIGVPQSTTRVKQAYVWGAAQALKEAGYSAAESNQLALKLAEVESARF